MADYDLIVWFPVGPDVTMSFRLPIAAKVTSNVKGRFWLIQAAGMPETSDLILGWQEIADHGWVWALDEMTSWAYALDLRQLGGGEEGEAEPAEGERPDGEADGGENEADEGEDDKHFGDSHGDTPPPAA